MTIWHGLLVNLAILSIFVSIWMQAYDAIDRMTAWRRTLTLSVLFIAGEVTVMMLPFQVSPGVQADLRSTFILLAGLFGGPVAAAGTAAAATVVRLLIGGHGAVMGIVGLSSTFIIALAYHFALRGRRPRSLDVVLASAAIAAALPVVWLFWFGFPSRETLVGMWLPITSIVLVATSISGLSIVREERRAATMRANQLYAAVIKALPNPLNAKDRDGRFILANPATAALMGAESAEALIGRTDFDFYARDAAARFKAGEARVLRDRIAFTEREQAEFPDGTTRWLETTKAPLYDRGGIEIGVISHNLDITEQQSLEDEHEEVRRQLAEALENMSDGLVVFDREERIVFCNSQYAALFPRTADLRVAGEALRDILTASIARGEQSLPPGLTLEQWIEQACAGVRQEGTREMHLLDGRWIEARVRPNENGRSLSLVSDVTAARVAQRALVSINARLEALAATDSLTGLANRRALDDALAREHARALRNGSQLSVLVIDVDRFKAYNDAYGHLQGDVCLKLVSDVLRAAVRRPADVVARFGGEEFVALLPETDAAGAWTRGEEIRKALKDLNIPHGASEKGRVTVTIGTATIASEDRLPGDLVRRADVALYVGKTSGRDQTQRSRTDREVMQLAG